ncbi:N-terminal double-transmembrane domain-containing protein OS=Singulisphaera acidiphila (strain ATCC BAA-1392 / DSM 18658 / VKM B-2454 / MOB10) GN=Sinac_2675 PE=4 SV=1: BatA: VWA_2 [Gemmataceae bacterium]|nr:N-terminal double-transmembrane domain-containing protein OS=Singulisphaera acidiphila (strain ATCC BAA-1392 / DSM 18658 / VKM B-2454 / MOB10) GN=Sinac_2675 PE=4 SV=1: BatA: VWA_2 [Gemmataceae bacterium]VTT99086.1 N-terminal double-transmembrane domain-containing protein OS=Singulisphaera acidiphila (strain ATCC BAA-1392 / DSM 18658 / VKM B-2454 / MOB10) GN=Sinac_2675 PE=4 SV=1: BatA: VWA_2 [Gemmataceae bacterium]
MNAILLTGAALVGLPVLLHLIMKQEPKRLNFPAFRFLTQKLKTNQRKLRLRHFVLLAMRMLLIALFSLTLYQPTVYSDRLHIRGEQPVATVVVIDTSPSMGYTAGDKTRLDEARRRALELLDELPDKSPVAVVTTDEPGAALWEPVADARKRIGKLDKPRAGGRPVTAAVSQGYQLLTKIETQDVEKPEELPKLLAVITDRAAASWDPGQAEDLKKLRDKVPAPVPAQAVIDVGVEKPMNVGILSAEMRPQVIPANQPASITVTVAATGPADLPPIEVNVLAKLDGANDAVVRQATVPYGQSRAVTFDFKDLKPGLHQVEFSLKAADMLMADNVRYLTFKVGEARRILTVADDPDGTAFWQLAHQSKGEFGCLVVRPGDVKLKDGRTVVEYPDPAKPNGKLVEENIRVFEVVALLGVADPSDKHGTLDTLWEKLRPYVEAGGKLVIAPGRDVKADGYLVGGNLVPGQFKTVIDTRKVDPAPPQQTAPGWEQPRDGRNGATWFLDDKVIQHPMLKPFQGWQAKGNVDAVKNPRRAVKYWEVSKAPEATVVVAYNDAEKPGDRRPAVLERGVPDPREPTRVKGRVVLLTTRLDVPTQDDPAWNDYWDLEGSTWSVVFPWLVARYLAGDTADANFNFIAGQTVTVPLPKGGLPRGTKVLLEGPGGAEPIEVGDKQTELRLGPPRTLFAGNFRVSLEPQWRDGFSLNAPAEESTLDKVPVEVIEDVTGKDTVAPLDKNVKLADILKVIVDQPIDLFPWLLIAVLMLLATEGLVANRFYRRPK